MKTSGSFLSIVLSVALLTSISLPSYSKDKTDKFFAKGGDISGLPQMESSGYTFYNDNGDKQDCFQILKEHGFNTIRLRTWVNPSDNRASGHCSKEETVAMAVRAQK